MKQIRKIVFSLTFFLILAQNANAHPMPSTMVLLKVHEKNISGEIQLPLNELQAAIGMGVNDNSDKLVERLGDSLRIYLMQHIRPRTFDSKSWTVTLGNMRVIETKSRISGDYKELVVEFAMAPPQHYDLRNFYFDYDAIVHQVITHKILVSLKQDWMQGIIAEDSTFQQVGVIALDVPSGKIKPFQVSLQQGGIWMGFKSMVVLGTKHIAEGTDHLMFLLVLLLPIPLMVQNKKWVSQRSIRESFIHILKVVTAFTIGHSITLLFGALGLVLLPNKPIEILIGISILVSAIHAIRPIFPNKEAYIAIGFGLIHGLAFANTLENLELNTSKLVLSILGFNIGIELMQLTVIVAVIPWLLLLSRTNLYHFLRIVGAFLAIIAALGWVIERIFEETNVITLTIEKASTYAVWLLGILVIVSVVSYFFKKDSVVLQEI
ncbi:hypothetical protein Emtol_0922 [Emticicia oligotrophica DSM 17448]|uniref:HupE/UreJ family protein n=1 Tax=Emticicia oligotrophica (strain DSM 17448 / CIP 109782 / MTCC 6937 / GPTSA100-15) TaxID=929562 RepID=A0ABN4AJ91_EMTOG|nr:HupE/UreJ family protein [Emticicia oligotrophica]AFK02073.1 hypothetical protein Emtol_0922 [Emticicia oligotrophica DSM 17448]